MKILELLIASLPSLLLVGFIYLQDKYEREKPIPLAICFLLGAVITLPARWLEEQAYYIGWRESDHFWITASVAFIVVAFNEELFKLGALVVYPFRQRFLNEPFDGIVYAMMIGMGFATVENIIYVYQYGLAETWGRAFTAVPSHGVYAILVGYFAGMAKLTNHPTQRWWSLGKGFLLAVLLHGAYDLFLIQEEAEWLMLLSIVLLYGSIFLLGK
ncbi:MAG: PrsW family intramembrane metalloprotease [Saprospiraceae bacterium]|nr:PrsW family intramembrane metalloprotease [Saprospiraceae bacterium]